MYRSYAASFASYCVLHAARGNCLEALGGALPSRYAADAVALRRLLPDQSNRRFHWHWLGLIATAYGHLDEAQQCQDESMAIFRRQDDRGGSHTHCRILATRPFRSAPCAGAVQLRPAALFRARRRVGARSRPAHAGCRRMGGRRGRGSPRAVRCQCRGVPRHLQHGESRARADRTRSGRLAQGFLR